MTLDSDAFTAMTLANSYMDARNYRRAEEVLRKALVHDPHHARLLTELARSQHFGGDNRTAARTALDALANAPHDGYPMRVYGSILVDMGRQKEGLEWARKAVDAAPLDHTMHYEYARLLTLAGRPAEALPVAKEALRMAPGDADAHDLMGVVLAMQGRRSEALAEHAKALELQPEHARATANIAVHRANRRNLSGAIAGFQRAAQLDPHLGDEARDTITKIVRAWLVCMLAIAFFALWLSTKVAEHNESVTRTPAARVIAGIGCIIFLILLGWLARALPRSLWRPVLLHREYRSLKIELAVGLVVAVMSGAVAVGVPINYWVLICTLLAGGLLSSFKNRSDKGWFDKALEKQRREQERWDKEFDKDS
jgi:Flp pilus assembly protein TadD